jgi:hypothetical protein
MFEVMSKIEFRQIPMTTMANLSGFKEGAKKKQIKSKKISATATSMFNVHIFF